MNKLDHFKNKLFNRTGVSILVIIFVVLAAILGIAKDTKELLNSKKEQTKKPVTNDTVNIYGNQINVSDSAEVHTIIMGDQISK